MWDAARMRMRRATPDWCPTIPFWRSLDEVGLRVIAFDVQMVPPAPLRNGIEIMSWGAHDQLTPFRAYPEMLGRDLLKRFGHHPMGAEIPVNKTPAELRSIKKNLIEGAARKGEAVRHLAQTHPWDLFVTVFGELHRGGHIFWPGGQDENFGDLLELYQAVDRALGTLVAVFEEQGATVTLFALHGMGFNTSQDHFMPAVMQRANAHYLSQSHVPATVSKFPAIRLLRERVPAWIQNFVAQKVPVQVRDWVVGRQVISGLDWNKTPGFALLADLHGYIRFNLRGREARGYFEPDSPELLSYMEWLERCFRSLRRREDAQPLVAEVVHARTIYPGERADSLPDLVIVWNDIPPAAHIDSDLLGEFDAEIATGRSGNHRPHGFVVIPKAETDTPPRTVEELAAFFVRGYQSAK
jgi:predicted AlkP superfamily phosphohydrolase/phosphomutase